MSTVPTSVANVLWGLACVPEAIFFQRALRDTEAAQRTVLFDILRRNSQTEFGRRYGFDSIRSVAEYQAQVPLSDHEDYREAIERIGSGERRVLTEEPVTLFEPTSGSTAATKLIPYTATLKAEFQRGVSAWMADLFRHDPLLLRGQAYWSISPVAQNDAYTTANIPIGFEDDSDYLGGVQGVLVRATQAVPPQVRHIGDMESFRYATLLFLLRSRSLSLISVWNPTFLLLLMEQLPTWWRQLADDIEAGTVTPPAILPANVQNALRRFNRPNVSRARAIRTAFAAGGGIGEIHARLWPNLRLVSCWADGYAAQYEGQVRALFPQARVQPKGLIATEGFVSFPLVGHTGAALALRSHFFEFLPHDGDAPLLAHQLEVGQPYTVVLTTGGGLYRYQLHDIVEVLGRVHDCPLLRFVGKAAHISDRFGEKVNEYHVRQAFTEIFERFGIRPAFAMLACEAFGETDAYTLFIEDALASDEMLAAVGQEVEAALQQNFHYRYCRDLEQLSALRLFRVESDAVTQYIAACQMQGQRAGDIKPFALHRLSGWKERFEGQLIPMEQSVEER